MSSVRSQLEGVVEAQRRKQLLVTFIAALIETLLCAALLFALLRLGLPNLALSRPRRIALSALVLVLFAIAFLIEQTRHARSETFWAKKIDDENRLEDHLVTALAFPDPLTSGFEQACVNALVLKLQTTQLRLPDVRLERLWLLVPALLIAAGTGVVEYRRKQRPLDDGRAAIVVPESLGKRAARLGEGTSAAGADERLVAQVEATKKSFEELVGKRFEKEALLERVSAAGQRLDAFDRANPSLIQAALQLGDPATRRAQQLLSAVQSGKTSAVTQALDTLEKALSGEEPPPLSPDERAEIAGMLDQLAKASGDPTLASKLKAAADAVADRSRNAEAASAIEAVKAPLGERISRDAATKQLESSLRGLLAATRREADAQAGGANGVLQGSADGGARQAGGPGLTASGNPDSVDGELGPAETGTAASGSGAGSATSPEYQGGTPERAETGKDERVSSPWVGAAVNQAIQASASGDKGAQDSVREQLGAQRRIAEREVQREEIPPEYAQSIQRYFFNLQQDWERQWKPTK